MTNHSSRRKFLAQSILTGAGLAIAPALGFSKTEEEAPSPETVSDPTTLDLYGQGPFYKSNAPTRIDGNLGDNTQAGDPILIYGYVVDAVNAHPIANAEIDIWHADDSGAYDNEGFLLRGKVYSDENGFYSFRTIKPGYYLNGNTYRPSHIHFKITPEGESSLITQLYFKDDPYIPTDAAASQTSGSFNASDRIIPLVLNGDEVFEGCWNIVIDVEDVVNGIGHNLNSGITYSIKHGEGDSLELYLGVFESGIVELDIISPSGKHLMTLVNRNLPEGKHALSESIKSHLSKGIYLAQLKINGKPTVPVRFKMN